MNRDLFHQYLNYPEQLNADSLLELEDLVQEYPYFQSARMLFVKNLKNLDNIRFNKQLKYAAAYINNRQFLFGLLNDIGISDDGSFIPLKMEVKPETVEPVITGEILSLAEDDIDNSDLVDRIEEESSYEKSIYVQELERYIPIADMDLLLFDFPIEDKETLDFDFQSELPDVSTDEIELVDESEKTIEPHGVSSRDLIDEFIKANPRMPKPEELEAGNQEISIEGSKESDAFMTETLAEIYLKQGYYYRALHAYEKLSLKYPEKSIYFASQIEKIKELITNQ